MTIVFADVHLTIDPVVVVALLTFATRAASVLQHYLAMRHLHPK